MNAPSSVKWIQPLLAKGKEIKAADPIVSYFCYYLAVQQILETKLHTTDTEVAELASEILNEIEAMKVSGGVLDNDRSKDILENDDASRAHVLNFAGSVFDKADRATVTGQVNMATGAGFAAAAVFLGLEAVWGELPPETSEKIKYSKFQAARILRSIKEGKNPNDLFAKEPEPDTDEFAESADPEDLISEKQSEEPFSVPHDNNDNNTNGIQLPQPPRSDPSDDLSLPHTPRDNLDTDIPLPEVPHEQPEGNEESDPPAIKKNISAPKIPPKPANKPKSVSKSVESAHNLADQSRELSTSRILALTQASDSAQKHAKYAISALNYDDVSTAISELENALSVLKLYQKQQT